MEGGNEQVKSLDASGRATRNGECASTAVDSPKAEILSQAASSFPPTSIASLRIDESGPQTTETMKTGKSAEKVSFANYFAQDCPGEAKTQEQPKTPAMAAAPVKKKNKKKKSAKKRGTGYEEFYADAPTTPEEYAHEKEILYPTSRPFSERIEECIQNYRSKRRLDSERANYFSKYLLVGGVESGPRAFAGVDIKEIQGGDMDKDDIRAATAIDFVNTGSDLYYRDGAEGWEVDWPGVVAGFLSNTLLDLSNYHPDKINLGIDVVENFLRYVITHEACPEYGSDLAKSLQVCKQARSEIHTIPDIRRSLPGEFNSLALLLCDPLLRFAPGTQEKMDRFNTVVSTWGDESLQKSLLVGSHGGDAGLPTITNIKDRKLEILEVLHPRSKTCPDEDDCCYINIPSICRITVRDTFIEDGFSSTQTEEEFHEGVQSGALKPETFHLWVDGEIAVGESEDVETQRGTTAMLMRPGQKMRAEIVETDGLGGLRLIKHVHDYFPSYYVFLWQNLMVGFKAPKDNTRPPPTVDDAVRYLDGQDGGDVEEVEDGPG